jgi:hypothetical protein
VRIRIQIQEDKNDPQKKKKVKKFHVLNCWMFSCSLGVLYRGLGISILQFLIKKYFFFSFKFFAIFGHQNPGYKTRSGSRPGSRSAIRKRGWIQIRIRIKSVRIRKTLFVLSRTVWHELRQADRGITWPRSPLPATTAGKETSYLRCLFSCSFLHHLSCLFVLSFSRFVEHIAFLFSCTSP